MIIRLLEDHHQLPISTVYITVPLLVQITFYSPPMTEQSGIQQTAQLGTPSAPTQPKSSPSLPTSAIGFWWAREATAITKSQTPRPFRTPRARLRIKRTMPPQSSTMETYSVCTIPRAAAAARSLPVRPDRACGRILMQPGAGNKLSC